MFIPIKPRFSGVHDAFQEHIVNDTMSITDPFKWLAEGAKKMEPVNEGLANQQAIFTAELGKWIDAENHQGLVANLMISIQGNAGIVIGRLEELGMQGLE